DDLSLCRCRRDRAVASSALPARLSALSVLVFAGITALSVLPNVEQVRRPAMSRIIDALVRDGLVKRETDKKDSRSVIITATEKGTRIMHEGRSRREKRLLDLLQPLRREEIDLIDRASEIISKELRTGNH